MSISDSATKSTEQYQKTDTAPWTSAKGLCKSERLFTLSKREKDQLENRAALYWSEVNLGMELLFPAYITYTTLVQTMVSPYRLVICLICFHITEVLIGLGVIWTTTTQCRVSTLTGERMIHTTTDVTHQDAWLKKQGSGIIYEHSSMINAKTHFTLKKRKLPSDNRFIVLTHSTVVL